MNAGVTLPALLEAAQATWPPAEVARDGGFETARGRGAGGRVSASRTVTPDWREADLEAAVTRHRAWGQPPLVRAFDTETRLQDLLGQLGWQRFKPTAVLATSIAALAVKPVARMAAFEAWPPLEIQRELWRAGGIGAARQEVMARAAQPKTALLARINDRVAGVAFVAVHAGVAVLHAVEVDPALRRHGAGEALIRKAAIWGGAEGASAVALAVSRANAGAVALYDKLGFTEAAGYAYWQRD